MSLYVVPFSQQNVSPSYPFLFMKQPTSNDASSESRMPEIIARHTGQSVERISKDTDRDFVLSAEQAKEYGIIDEVKTRRKE